MVHIRFDLIHMLSGGENFKNQIIKRNISYSQKFYWTKWEFVIKTLVDIFARFYLARWTGFRMSVQLC